MKVKHTAIREMVFGMRMIIAVTQKGEAMSDLIDRHEAIDALNSLQKFSLIDSNEYLHGVGVRLKFAVQKLEQLPSVQPERDIPMKPNETIDSSWGLRKKQAVCPKCDHYLSRIYFLGDSKNKKVTYCETCGQAIDWEGWEWEE